MLLADLDYEFVGGRISVAKIRDKGLEVATVFRIEHIGATTLYTITQRNIATHYGLDALTAQCVLMDMFPEAA